MGARLEFGILGPLEVRLDGRPVRVGGPRQRALLALLLCNANQVVSRERLIDELLGDQPVESAERMLRVQISRLRKSLATASDERRLIARPPGYLLRVEDGEFDLHSFEHRLAAARDAVKQNDPEEAAALLREAASLWRGRPLADLEFEPFAQFEAQRLEELRLVAQEERNDADLALGRHSALGPELEALVAEHPLRERLRGQLMLALYRSGRQADALEVYRAGRARLVEELALEPGPQLRQLEHAILQQDGALEFPSTTTGGAIASAVAPRLEAPVALEPPASDERDAGSGRSGALSRRGTLAFCVGVAACVAAVIASQQHGVGAVRRLTPRIRNGLALIADGGASVHATVPLQSPPTDVTSGFGSLWASEASSGLVVRVSVSRRDVLARIPVGTRPSRIIAAAGRVWVLDPVDATVSAINPGTDTVEQTITVGSDPSDIVLSDGSLWISDHGDGTVTRLDPNTGRTQELVRTGGDPSGLATTTGAVWVATDEAGTVDRIDARTGAITNTIRVGDAPTAIAATPDELWVLDPLDATASRIDPATDTILATIPVGGAPSAITQDDGSIWVTDGQLGTLQRIDPQHDEIAKTLTLSGSPGAMTAGSRLWVAVDGAGTGRRGGTLTSAIGYANFDTIDPAASNAPNVPPPQEFGLTNDGLVTLDHVAGSDGARLVPDLAVALPVPSDHGLTYVFHLRPSIRYSTGALVKPSDITHSFERLFTINSSGAAFYMSIAGAAACVRTPKHCDLSHGIVADDRAGTVIFHLTEPNPDFLNQLTLAYADVLPASTPARQATSPPPATGPYMIARYQPGRELQLVRNPRFREWSAAAQPDGYPNQIVLRLDLNEARGATAIADEKADFSPNLGAIPGRAAAYLLKHDRDQVHVNPQLITGFMFLNVHVAPFNNVLVRRALNLALNRRAIANAYGGPLAAQPTCQVLPPGLSGYRRYCPYTRDPNRQGGWRAPDLSKARRLVAASHTKGMTVTVWNDPTPTDAVAETQAAVTALSELGYRARLRLLPVDTYYTYTNDSRNRAQVIDGGWSADYASADDFLGKLTCSYFVPNDGLDTTDDSEYCNRAYDQQVAQTAALQATDPLAADAAWARLDREITNLAIWVPTVTPNEIDLVSRRVGNYKYNPVWGALIDQLWVRRDERTTP